MSVVDRLYFTITHQHPVDLTSYFSELATSREFLYFIVNSYIVLLATDTRLSVSNILLCIVWPYIMVKLN